MFRSHAVKIIISFLGLSALTIGFLVLWLTGGAKTAKFAQAEIAGTPLQGWAWADTIGWLSLNCRNEDICGTADYWVGVDETTGRLDGYAWSDNVGWISFRKTGICMNGSEVEMNADNSPKNCEADSGCINNSCQYFTPPNYDFQGNCKIDNVAKPCSIADGCVACYNNVDRKFYGWARVLSEASINNQYDASWIKLDVLVSGNDYGAKVSKFDSDDNDIEEATGEPEGGALWGDLVDWAWGGANASLGSNSTSGLGWISFNCVNEASCPSVNSYKVTGRPNTLGNLQVTRINGDDSHGLSVDWTNGYPAYGATWYEVWRQNGRCSNIAEDCDNDDYCPGGTCNLLSYDKKQTTSGGPPWLDRPLNLFVTYKYVVRACNIFACSKTSVRNLQTSPIEAIHKFKATPICAAPSTQQASYVDMTWSKPYIFSLFLNSGGALASYELDYCKLDVGGDVSKCGPGLLSAGQGYWEPAGADCSSPITQNIQGDTYTCREILAGNNPRYQSKDFYVYRVRGVADRGTCAGGDNDGQSCDADADCVAGGGTCNFFKSTWAFSNVFRICPVGTSYKEERPQ